MRRLSALLLASASLTLGLACPAHADGETGGTTTGTTTTGTATNGTGAVTGTGGHGDGGMWWPP